jgi:protein phosphatase
MRFYGLTDIGRQRQENQDNIYLSKPEDDLKLFIVADGMGGINGGDIASKDAIDNIRSYITAEFNNINHDGVEIEALIKKSIIRANKYIYEKAKLYPEYKGMGTTLIVAIVYKHKVHIGHVGDSRVYRIRKNIIRQLTKDHSYVQTLISEGTITKEQAKKHPQKNMILKALGPEKNVEPDVFTKGFIKEDVLLICTDGLTNMLEDKDIYQTIIKYKDNLNNACEALINNANMLGGLDNISAVLISND